MSLRGAAAIIGIGEVKPERRMEGRTAMGVRTVIERGEPVARHEARA